MVFFQHKRRDSDQPVCPLFLTSSQKTWFTHLTLLQKQESIHAEEKGSLGYQDMRTNRSRPPLLGGGPAQHLENPSCCSIGFVSWGTRGLDSDSHGVDVRGLGKETLSVRPQTSRRSQWRSISPTGAVNLPQSCSSHQYNQHTRQEIGGYTVSGLKRLGERIVFQIFSFSVWKSHEHLEINYLNQWKCSASAR